MDIQAIVPLMLAAGGIVLVDIVLSGDNALVIGAAASRLPRGQRLQAIFLGGLGAIVFRGLLAIGATELLLLPLLQAIGGAVLLVIAVRLLIPENDDNAGARRQSDKLLPAIFTILVADLTMSLDNVLAVGALAHGNVPLLAVGLIFSMTLLFVASALIAQLISRFTWLLDLAAAVLAYTAANLIIEDPIVSPLLHLRTGPQGPTTIWALALQIGLVALVLAIDGVLRLYRLRHRRKGAHQSPAVAAVSAVEDAMIPASVNGHGSPAGSSPEPLNGRAGLPNVDVNAGVAAAGAGVLTDAGADGAETQAEMQRAAAWTPEEAEA